MAKGDFKKQMKSGRNLNKDRIIKRGDLCYFNKGDNNATKMSNKPLDQFMATAFPPVSRWRRRRVLIDFEDHGEQVE